MLVDHHCHLDHNDFDNNLDGVVERAKNAGIGLLVNISTRVHRFENFIKIIDKYQNVYGTVGTHPHYAHEELDITSKDLQKISQHPKIIGIGEAGLDYYYKLSTPDAQHQSFRTHISAARETGLPLEIHTRDADRETIEVLESEFAKGPFPALLHCFTGGRDLAMKAIDLGLYISFSGIITFKKSNALREIASEIPLDKILVETDSPYLAPDPFRGKRNEPSYIIHTAQAIANLRKVSFDEFCKISTNNFYRLFTKVLPLANSQ